MLTVKDLLRMKAEGVWAVGPETSTLNTLRFMAEKNVGALLVIEDGLMVGIVSERDFVYRIAQDRNLDLDAPIRDYMTSEVITVSPETTIQECMQVMTDRRIRHLPVFSGETLAGLVSIGDVVKGTIGEQSSTINNLENYIMGTGYGQ
jgi:CBS domain-containing protein